MFINFDIYDGVYRFLLAAGMDKVMANANAERIEHKCRNGGSSFQMAIEALKAK